MRTTIIVNPKAGSAATRIETLRRLVAGLPEASLCESERPGHARALAAQAVAGGSELIVAAGGDGTIHEVVQGLAPDFQRVRFGVIPLGTGNDVARTLGIPEDPAEAVALLSQGAERAVDLIRVKMAGAVHYGVNVAAGGFSGQVDEVLTEEMKATWGPLAYVRGAVPVLPNLTGYDTRIAWDSGELERIQALNVVVANGRTCAGGIRVAPTADPTDGLLDVVVVRYGSWLDLAKVAARLLVGDYLESDDVSLRRVRRIEITSRPGMWFNVDGELIGNGPVYFEVVPGAFRVLTRHDSS